MPASQFIFWPVNLPEDQAPNMQSKQDNNSGFNAVPQPAPPRTRTRKSAKQAAPKRPPQRGLGVAQLERLRMEQAGETEIVMQQQQPRRVVLPQMLVGSYAAASQVGSGGGVLPGGFPVGAMGLLPPGYMGRYLAPQQAPEPPSTQIVPRVPVQLSTPPVDPVQCFSDQCEFCLRKKRLFGEGSVVDNMDGDYHLDTDLSATVTPSADQEFMASLERRNRKVLPVERQTREYQFFPTCGGSLGAETTFPATVDASMSMPTPAYPSQPIDLSLKLSF